MHRSFFAALCSLTALSAQSVTTTLSALTPITVQVAAAAQATQASQPAGPLALSGSLQANLLVGPVAPFGSVAWMAQDEAVQSRVSLVHQLQPLGTGASIRMPPQEFLVRFTASAAPVPYHLELLRWSSFSIGAAMPQISVDFGNDGTIDLQNVPFGSWSFGAGSIGAAPFDVRVVMSSSVVGPDNSATSLDILLRPDNNLSITLDAVACAPQAVAWLLEPAPVFASRGVRLHLQAGNDPALFVLGLAQQPVLLPVYLGTACLLTPSPDAVLYVPTGFLDVPLPAAVRPVSFHVQGVAVTSAGLLTTDGYRVLAN